MQHDYTKVKDSFFDSYKSFINFIENIQEEHSICIILVLKRKNKDNDLSTVDVIVRNSNNDGRKYNEFSSYITLPDTYANILVDDIRNDFKNNHYISYTSLNPRTHIQTLQNTKFTLNIKLYNQNEYEEAITFNQEVNSSKRRILTKC